MKDHFIRHAGSVGGWTLEPSLYSILHLADNSHLFPYGIHLMDNDEIILLAGLHDMCEKRYACVVAFSTDLGATWSHPRDTGVYGRPVATAYSVTAPSSSLTRPSPGATSPPSGRSAMTMAEHGRWWPRPR